MDNMKSSCIFTSYLKTNKMKTLTINQKINLKSHTSKRKLKSGLLGLYDNANRNYNSGIDYKGTAQWDSPLQLSDIQSASSFGKRYIHD